MSAPPYMKLYWGDYSRKTRHLTKAAEHGAYLMLIGALWDNGGKLPADDETLARYALVTAKEWAALKPKIMPFFKVARGVLSQQRVTEELAKYESTSGKRKAAGKAGGTAKAGKQTENPLAIAKQNDGKSPHNQNQISEEETPIAPKGAATIRLRKAHVEAAWEITPPTARARTSRTDIETALKAAARRGHEPEAVIEGLKAYYRTPEAVRDDGRFAKGAHRIIAGDRWKDFTEPTPIEQLAKAPDPTDVWRARMAKYLTGSRYWNTNDWGPVPWREGCDVPAAVLAEFENQRPTTAPPQGAAA